MDLYTANRWAWIAMKERLARRMSLQGLWASLLDCREAAADMPWLAEKLDSEAEVYAQELSRRGADPEAVPEGVRLLWA